MKEIAFILADLLDKLFYISNYIRILNLKKALEKDNYASKNITNEEKIMFIKNRIYILLKENNINDDLNIFVLKASSSIKGMSVTDQIYNDYKSYTVGNGQIGIGQLITMDFDEISKDIQTYVDKLNEMTQMDYSLVALFITEKICI